MIFDCWRESWADLIHRMRSAANATYANLERVPAAAVLLLPRAAAHNAEVVKRNPARPKATNGSRRSPLGVTSLRCRVWWIRLVCPSTSNLFPSLNWLPHSRGPPPYREGSQYQASHYGKEARGQLGHHTGQLSHHTSCPSFTWATLDSLTESPPSRRPPRHAVGSALPAWKSANVSPPVN